MSGFVFMLKIQLYESLTAADVCVCVSALARACVGEGDFCEVTTVKMHIGLSALYGKWMCVRVCLCMRVYSSCVCGCCCYCVYVRFCLYSLSQPVCVLITLPKPWGQLCHCVFVDVSGMLVGFSVRSGKIKVSLRSRGLIQHKKGEKVCFSTQICWYI